MEREQKKFYKKLFVYVFFSIIKNVFHYMFAKFILPNSGRMQSQMCCARARGAILAHAASCVKFDGYFESTSTKQYSTKFFRS